MTSATLPAPAKAPAAKGRRLDPVARRQQLVEAGLQMVKSVPLDQITADELAQSAGVSKGLVFHYFPATRDLHIALLNAAANELFEQLDPGDDVVPELRLRAGIEAFIDYIHQQPATYLALARSAGSDPEMREVFERTRMAVVGLIQGALGIAELTPMARIALRGWLATVEEAVLHWLDDTPVPRQELVDFLYGAAFSLLGLGFGLAPGDVVGPIGLAPSKD